MVGRGDRECVFRSSLKKKERLKRKQIPVRHLERNSYNKETRRSPFVF